MSKHDLITSAVLLVVQHGDNRNGEEQLRQIIKIAVEVDPGVREKHIAPVLQELHRLGFIRRDENDRIVLASVGLAYLEAVKKQGYCIKRN